MARLSRIAGLWSVPLVGFVVNRLTQFSRLAGYGDSPRCWARRNEAARAEVPGHVMTVVREKKQARVEYEAEQDDWFLRILRFSVSR